MATKKILLIDEEAISIRYISREIERSFNDAVSLTVCKTCSKGLYEFKTNIYDVIVLDIQLPRGDVEFNNNRQDLKYGLDVLDIIRKENPNQPVICFTILNQDVSKIIESKKAIHICKLEENSNRKLIKEIQNIIKIT